MNIKCMCYKKSINFFVKFKPTLERTDKML